MVHAASAAQVPQTRRGSAARARVFCVRQGRVAEGVKARKILPPAQALDSRIFLSERCAYAPRRLRRALFLRPALRAYSALRNNRRRRRRRRSHRKFFRAPQCRNVERMAFRARWRCADFRPLARAVFKLGGIGNARVFVCVAAQNASAARRRLSEIGKPREDVPCGRHSRRLRSRRRVGRAARLVRGLRRRRGVLLFWRKQARRTQGNFENVEVLACGARKFRRRKGGAGDFPQS